MNKVPEALDALAVDGSNGASKVPCTFELSRICKMVQFV